MNLSTFETTSGDRNKHLLGFSIALRVLGNWAIQVIACREADEISKLR